MAIVTLTSDFGWDDHYLAVVKGYLVSSTPDLNILDISHNVKNFDIVQAAFIFKNAWRSFPVGSIHLLLVNDLARSELSYLLIKQFDQFFICPDNGMLGLIFEQPKGQIYRLPLPDKQKKTTFKHILALTVNRITRKVPLEQLGEPTSEIIERFTVRPIISKDFIRGSIVYIDTYENAISNIHKSLFDKVGKKRPFEISFKRHPPITQLSQHYSDVEVGHPLSLFNEAGFLEIAINMGTAASLLAIRIEDMLQIDFK